MPITVSKPKAKPNKIITICHEKGKFSLQELEDIFEQLTQGIKRELPDALILFVPEGMYIRDINNLD
jgi:hypothetical protein